MAFADVTKVFVDRLTYSRFATETSDNAEFEAIKQMQSDAYLNTNTDSMPDLKYNRALSLLVAHYYELANIIGGGSGSTPASGAVNNESVGDVSIGYAVSTPMAPVVSEQYLNRTSWGQEFLYLMKTFKPTPLVTG